MEVKIKLLNELAKIPKYGRDGDAGLDFTATDLKYIENDDGKLDILEYSTGVCIEIPNGYVGLVYPRSSLSNYDLLLCNHVGVIDSNYRGEIVFRFKITDRTKTYWNTYSIGDRIGQLMIIPYPAIKFVEVKDLSDSNRAENGFGSSGN